MNSDAARALLDEMEERQSRLMGRPMRPSDLAAQRKDPIPAVARRLADLLAVELRGSDRPSERVELRQEIETALLRIFQGGVELRKVLPAAK